MTHHPLPLPRHLRQLWSGRLFTLVIFLLAVTVTEILNRTELARLEAFNRSGVTNQASTLRAAFDNELNSTLFLASGLVGYVEVHRTLDREETQRVLASIFRHGRHLRKTDTVARIGGDEFVMVLPRLICIEEAVNVARKLLEAIAAPIAVADHTVAVGGSIGISLFPEHGTTAEELLKSADHAMYTVKSRGKNGIYVLPTADNQQGLLM